MDVAGQIEYLERASRYEFPIVEYFAQVIAKRGASALGPVIAAIHKGAEDAQIPWRVEVDLLQVVHYMAESCVAEAWSSETLGECEHLVQEMAIVQKVPTDGWFENAAWNDAVKGLERISLERHSRGVMRATGSHCHRVASSRGPTVSFRCGCFRCGCFRGAGAVLGASERAYGISTILPRVCRRSSSV